LKLQQLNEINSLKVQIQQQQNEINSLMQQIQQPNKIIITELEEDTFTPGRNYILSNNNVFYRAIVELLS